MPREMDYYGLLGVARDASEAEIRERFRTLAREAHPDRAPAAKKAEAEGKFQDLTEAVNVLTSPERRKAYDFDLGDKFDIFHAIGIQYYAIIDRENYEDPWTLAGYERTSRKYRSLPLDERGRLWLEAVGVWLAVEGDEVICYDASGKRLGDYVQVSEYADQEHERAEKEQQRAEKALKRAEKEQQRAEKEREQAAKERERADKQRERAESAEARTRELEAELARFRRPTSPG